MSRSHLVFLTAIVFIFVGILPAQTGRPAGAPADTEAETRTIHLVVDKGAPMWLALAKRLPTKHAGERVEATLIEPLYAFDRIVAPAGSTVLGRVVHVEPVSQQKRARAIMAGDFTPLRVAQIQFETLVLKDGKRMPLQTKVSAGLPEIVQLQSQSVAAQSAAANKRQSRTHEMAELAKQEIKAKRKETLDAFRKPGKMKRVEAWALAMLPYHSQTMPVGTRFDAQLLAPLDFGGATLTAQDLVKIGSPEPPVGIVHARLITPLSSATAQRGKPVEALVSQPMYAADHHLLLPVGSRLEGTVLQAQPARWMNRTGSLRFTFRRILPPSGLEQSIEGNLSGVAASRDAHIKLDAEGGAHATHPKSGYIMPALAVVLAASTIEGVDGKAGPQRDAGENAPGRVASGGIAFGLLGSLASMSSTVAATAIGFYGAGWQVYSHFIARGTEVVFPIDTPMEITLGSHGNPTQKFTGSPKSPGGK